jgi:hypothetical protein
MTATWYNNSIWKSSDVWKKLPLETKQQILGIYKEKRSIPKNIKNFEKDEEGGER